jgi:glycosyltransferase involved in cell wall biosynthesis
MRVAVTLDAESGELRSARLPGETTKVVEFLAKLPGPTRVAYEAGRRDRATSRSWILDSMTADAAAQTTVVIPVWDEYVSPWLADALASVREQDLQTPIIVVDNASDVPLPELAGMSVVRAPRRLTPGEARDLGLARVGTAYVVAWDADDLMLPGTLSFLQDAIGADPTLAAFATAIVEHPSGKRHRWPRRWIAVAVRAPRLFALLNSMWSLYPTTGATIMRTELVRAAGGFGETRSLSGEDWCLGVSLAFRGRIGWSEVPGRVYRLHDRSILARHRTLRHQRQKARNVRARIHADAGIPGWARRMLPLIALAQYAALAGHALVRFARGVRRACRS